MNIGIIHGFVGGGGGTEKALHSILHTLGKTEHHITLYTVSKPKFKSERIKIKSLLPFSISSFGLYQRLMEQKLVAKAKDEDILIQTSGGVCIPNHDQKLITYAHSDFTNELNHAATKYNGIWSLYYKPYYHMIKKFIQRISNTDIIIISDSEFIRNSIKSKYGKDSTVIYPPVDLGQFASGCSKYNQVVTVGRFSPEKNHEFGLKAMAEMKADYFIVGSTNTKLNESYYEKLQSIIKKQRLKYKVTLAKNINRGHLISIVNTSAVYFHCSNETFGISVVEGIAGGCIPIVPDTSANKETVPIKELRYKENDPYDAHLKIKKALLGEYDKHLPELQKHIKMFSINNFEKSWRKYIDAI